MVGSILERKRKYVDHFASEGGVYWATEQMIAALDRILLDIGWNLSFQFLLNLELNLNYGVEIDQFDFPPVEWRVEVEKLRLAYYSDRCGLWGNEYYGIAYFVEPGREPDYGKWGRCVLDPNSITGLDISRLTWFLRHRTTTRDPGFWLSGSKPLAGEMAYYRELLMGKGVSGEYVDALLTMLARVEGKMIGSAYFDVSVFDGAHFPREGGEGVFLVSHEARATGDWQTQVELETNFPIEAHFDYSHWDYARFWEGGLRLKPEVGVELDKRIREFQERGAYTSQYGQKIFYPEVFLLQRTEKTHWVGGDHQIRLQNIIVLVKPILDRHGLVGMMRTPYLRFAQELAYLKHEPGRRWKRWKHLLTEDDLREKYKRVGCDPHILNEVENVVKGVRI